MSIWLVCHARSMSDPLQSLRDALALTTNAMHDRETGSPWTETLLLARELEATGRVDEVLLAQSHLTLSLLDYIAQLTIGADAEGITLSGIPGGTSPGNLLKEFGRQLLEAEPG
ncbi:hypothetical protein GCM10022415_33540 [Knoellia locipacati]|uniref:Uncharacterized protein n=1 Tax=Knoellia locipacati TaxID=882824 RepID=A0A512T4Z0_9MICO|nr:hypothetical protein KLO01_32800 [Knoellia locipacati]